MFDTDPRPNVQLVAHDERLTAAFTRIRSLEAQVDYLSATVTALQTRARRKPRQRDWASIVAPGAGTVFLAVAALAFLLLAGLVSK